MKLKIFKISIKILLIIVLILGFWGLLELILLLPNHKIEDLHGIYRLIFIITMLIICIISGLYVGISAKIFHYISNKLRNFHAD